MTEVDIAALRLTAKQFGELAATIYGQMYDTLRAQDIPQERLETMTQSCFVTMAHAIASVVEKKLDIPIGHIDEAVRMMAHALRSSGN